MNVNEYDSSGSESGSDDGDGDGEGSEENEGKEEEGNEEEDDEEFDEDKVFSKLKELREMESDGDDEVVTSPAGRGGYDPKTAILKPKVPTNSIRATSAIPTGGGGDGGRILQLAPGGKVRTETRNEATRWECDNCGRKLSALLV